VLPFTYLIIGLVCLAFALLIHEFAHAWMAYQLGDPTAKYEGRLTLNPTVHFEPIGAICLAVTYIATHGTVIMGWAKPVPINSENFKNDSLDTALVAVAGPFINFLVAVGCSMLYLLGVFSNTPVQIVLGILMACNVGFGLFNLIPWPPLDGWKIMAAVMPAGVRRQMRSLENQLGIWSLVVLLVILWIGGKELLGIANGYALAFLTGHH
jgi:Zn-dependent protease